MKNCYCIHCGYKNDMQNKYCHHCHKKLKEKDHALYQYIFEQSIDDIKDNAVSSIIDKVKFFIHKYLYGIMISLTVVATVSVNIAVRNQNSDFIVQEKPKLSDSFMKYTSTDTLLETFKNAYLRQDIKTLYTLMYDTNFVKEANQLGLYPSKNSLMTDIDIFTKSSPHILYSATSFNGVSNIESYGDIAVKLKDSAYSLYYASLSFVYYAENNNEMEEITFFDYDLFLVNIEDNYYIAGIVYLNEPSRLEKFYDVLGDVSLYDM